ncbi:MAG: hypothetical protein E5Y73_11435 [Mesorhizobium sp.]|uniref:hypothetical protein n=1 Tax=Mesorhizobium sp. TaxID=1871066 RepID=UPI00122013E0|nr:hypothetical protein [Mesorhizobium sp.]TIL94524.1 MAG: hypothetical protein E5Y73_11435 [Mesorhizobium sp.]
MRADQAAIDFVAQELVAAEANVIRLRAMLAKMRAADESVDDDVDGPWISPKQGAAMVSRDVSTVIRWIEKYNIGRRNGGRLEVSKPRLEAIARHR